jgi:hypothetical protein
MAVHLTAEQRRVGCHKSVGAVTSSFRLTEGYDAPSLARRRWRRSVWSGHSSTWRCVAALSCSCSASGRRRPRRSRSWCYATSLRCCAASIHGPACSPPTERCLRRGAGCSHGRAGRCSWYDPRRHCCVAPTLGTLKRRPRYWIRSSRPARRTRRPDAGPLARRLPVRSGRGERSAPAHAR